MLKNKALITLLIFSLLGIVAEAQNNTNSPYSRYGYGILDDNSFGMGRAMGGIGYGLRSSRQINVMNPASYSAMDSLTFLFDFGVNFQTTWMKEGSLKETNMNGNLEYLAMQFPLGKHLAASIGLLPFSYVGYSFGGSINNKNSGTIGTDTKIGSGGINQAYLGLSAELFKGFSIGVNVGYLFGDITNANYIIPTEISSFNGLFERKTHVSDYQIQAGLQYTQKLSEKSKMIFGVVYSPRKALLGKTYSITTPYSSLAEETSTSIEKNTRKDYALPNTYGGGFTYVWDNRLTVGGDFTYQDWASVRYDGVKDSLNNRFKIAIGGEYLPSLTEKSYFKRMRYRIGAFYNQSYLKIGSNTLQEMGVSCGVGLPIKNDKSIINIAVEYVNKQTQPKVLITENYLRLSVSLTFNEFWFFKRKFE